MPTPKKDGRPYMPTKVKSVEHGTPQWLFQQFNEKFRFTLDAASSYELRKCERYYNKKQDGLTKDWTGERVWLNPPHNAASLKAWSKKAYEESRKPNTLVAMLVPAKTDQSWWHDYALKAERWFIPGRVQFEGSEHGDMKSIIILVFEKGRRATARSLKRADRVGKKRRRDD